MKATKTRRLSLCRETIGHMADRDLGAVVGGAGRAPQTGHGRCAGHVPQTTPCSNVNSCVFDCDAPTMNS